MTAPAAPEGPAAAQGAVTARGPATGPGLSIRDLRVRLAGREVLSEVDLGVRPGEVAAVVGGDGAGKTTLLRTIAGSQRAAAGSVATPELTTALLGAGIFGDLTVTENLAFVAAAHGLGDWRDRAEELLEIADLTAARERRGDQLSGGMARKLATIVALLPEPGLVVLDEPTTGVDPVSREQLWELFVHAARRGAAVVVATTYLDEAERADTVLVLEDGRVLASGTPAEVVVAMPGRVGLVAERPPDRPSWRHGRGWMIHDPAGELPDDAEPVAADLQAAVVVAQLERAGRTTGGGDDTDRPRRGRGPTAVGAAGSRDRREPVLAADRVVKRFGATVAVDGVSMQVRPGEVVGLVGANGAGKTTLMRLLLGLAQPDGGTVRLLGGPPTTGALEHVGYVPQTLGLWRDLTVGANLQLLRAVYGYGGDPPAAVAEGADTLVGSLPLGRQRRLAFALALDHDPAVLVLDEPTSGVDPLGRARLWETIRSAADTGVGALVSTHYLDEAAQCDRVVLLADGRVAASGLPADLARAGESTTAALRRLLTAGSRRGEG